MGGWNSGFVRLDCEAVLVTYDCIPHQVGRQMLAQLGRRSDPRPVVLTVTRPTLARESKMLVQTPRVLSRFRSSEFRLLRYRNR